MSADNVECPTYGPDKTFHVIVRMRPPSWISLKGKKKFQRSQILTNGHEKLGDGFFQFLLCSPATANRNQWRRGRFRCELISKERFVKTKPNLMACFEALSQLQKRNLVSFGS